MAKRALHVIAVLVALAPAGSKGSEPGGEGRPAVKDHEAVADEAGLGTRLSVCQEVARLAGRLRAERKEHRDRAERELQQLLEACVGRLAAASNEGDAEASARVQRVLSSLAWHVRVARALVSLPPGLRPKLRVIKASEPKLFCAALSADAARRAAALDRVLRATDRTAQYEPLLILGLRDADKGVRLAALKLARTGRYRDDATVDALTDLLVNARPADWLGACKLGGRSTSPIALVEAATALQEIGLPRPVPSLVALMRRPVGRNMLRDTLLAETLAKLGDVRAVPHLVDLLRYTSVRFRYREAQAVITVAPSDAALMALVELTGQDAAHYGFARLPPIESARGIKWGFASVDDRRGAVARFRQWWNLHKSTPPYSKLEALELPALPAQAGQ